jgi:hypothetical protein
VQVNEAVGLNIRCSCNERNSYLDAEDGSISLGNIFHIKWVGLVVIIMKLRLTKKTQAIIGKQTYITLLCMED